MATAHRLDRTLHATLYEIERGLFHARYRQAGFVPDTAGLATKLNGLPLYHVAPTASDAKRIIELSAGAIGFDRVVWEDQDADQAVMPVPGARGRPSGGLAASNL